MKYIFIVNRTSGTTDYDRLENNINTYMEGHDYKIIETKCPMDATKIASKYKMDKDVIIYSCGGDGTLNEIINGIACGKCKLGIIPTGSGNDFYKSVKSYKKKESTIDLGLIGNRYFINIASVGFDAEVANYANEIKNASKNKKIAYIKGVLKAFRKYHNREYKIEVDNKIYNGKYTLLAICNGRYYGGGFKIAPLASFDDDHFDVYLAKNMNRLKLIFMLIKLLRGKHEKASVVKKLKALNMIVKCDEEMIVNIDGEIIKTKKLDIKMIPNAITLVNDASLAEKILS